MKTLPKTTALRTALLFAGLCGWLLTGCATQKVDWAGRVGQYTYDQVILEIGPPDKQSHLTDGTVVADWLTRRGYAYSSPTFGYAPWPYYGPYYPGFVGPSAPDHFLRLTFGPDGKLTAWRKFAR
jgi:hypothetical protein